MKTENEKQLIKFSLSLRRYVYNVPPYFLCTLLFLAMAGSPKAETLVIPTGAETRENVYNITLPFSSPGDIRSQQIYSPSLFPVLPAPGQAYQLDGVAFRLSSHSIGGFSSQATFDRVEVRISSSSGPFTSSLNQNHSANMIVVYDQRTTLQGRVPPGTTPSEFDLHLSFSTPFYYSPSDGSLVLEVRKYGGRSPILSTLAGADIPGVTYYYGTIDGSFTDTSGRIGLETRFQYQVVPEPSFFVLLAFAMCILLAVRRL